MTKKIIAIGISVFFVSLLCGISIRYGEELLNARAIERMMDALTNIRSFEYQFELDSSGVALEQDGVLYWVIRGFFDYNDLLNPRNNAIINFKAEQGGEIFSGNLELRMIKDVVYAVLHYFEGKGPMGILLSSLENKWVSFETKQASYQLKETDLSTVSKAFAKTAVFKARKIFEDEIIDGVEVSRYRIGVRKNELRKFIKEIHGATSERVDEDVLFQIDEALSQIVFPEGELWIRNEDNLPHKIMIAPSFANNDAELKGTLEISFSNYNRIFILEPPMTSTSFADIVGMFFEE